MTDYQIYKQKAEAQIKEWEAELDKLKAKAQKAQAEGKAEYQDEINELEDKLAKGREILNELSERGSEAWESMRQGMDKAWSALSSSFKEAKAKF
jgi:chromosome segregation ATPase